MQAGGTLLASLRGRRGRPNQRGEPAAAAAAYLVATGKMEEAMKN
jgi:hypothetical protein